MTDLDPNGLEAAAKATYDEWYNAAPDTWDGEHDEGTRVQFREVAEAAVRAYIAASASSPSEEAVRLDERERLSARVYEIGWCPTCGRAADGGVPAILVDPAEVLSPEELAEYERCQQSVIDARRNAPMVEGNMIVGASAPSPSPPEPQTGSIRSAPPSPHGRAGAFKSSPPSLADIDTGEGWYET